MSLFKKFFRYLCLISLIFICSSFNLYAWNSYSLRVIFIGAPEQGKTALADAMFFGRPEEPKEYRTAFVYDRTALIQFDEMETTLCIYVRDTPGKVEKKHSTSDKDKYKFYSGKHFGESHIVFICVGLDTRIDWNNRDEVQNYIFHWLDIARGKNDAANGCIVVLVGTRGNLAENADFEVNRVRLREIAANSRYGIHEYLKIDATVPELAKSYFTNIIRKYLNVLVPIIRNFHVECPLCYEFDSCLLL